MGEPDSSKETSSLNAETTADDQRYSFPRDPSITVSVSVESARELDFEEDSERPCYLPDDQDVGNSGGDESLIGDAVHDIADAPLDQEMYTQHVDKDLSAFVTGDAEKDSRHLLSEDSAPADTDGRDTELEAPTVETSNGEEQALDGVDNGTMIVGGEEDATDIRQKEGSASQLLPDGLIAAESPIQVSVSETPDTPAPSAPALGQGLDPSLSRPDSGSETGAASPRSSPAGSSGYLASNGSGAALGEVSGEEANEPHGTSQRRGGLPGPARGGPPPGKKHSEEDETSPAWRQRKKHFFVLSNAGKPIYSRYGDEHRLAGFNGILQAIISFVANGGDRIRVITAGLHLIVFLLKGPLYLVAVSSAGEPVKGLTEQLELLHGQMLLILTNGVEKAFTRSSKFDMRPLLVGTEPVFASLTRSFSWDPATFLHAFSCVQLPWTVRRAAGAALLGAASEHLLFALLLQGRKVITVAGQRRAALHPDDILLLVNFVTSSHSFRSSESFSPVCLPHCNPGAFMYAYVAYLEPGTCLILVTRQQDAFFSLKSSRVEVEDALRRDGVLREAAVSASRGGLRVENLPWDDLETSATWPRPYVGDGSSSAGVDGPIDTPGASESDGEGRFDRGFFQGGEVQGLGLGLGSSNSRAAPGSAGGGPGLGQRGAAKLAPKGLWHFLYRSSVLDQWLAADFSPPLHTRPAQKRLFRAYQRVHASMHGDGGPPAGSRMQYIRDSHHVLLAWRTSDFEIYVAFDPLAEKASAIAVSNRICQWLRDMESDLFLVGTPALTW